MRKTLLIPLLVVGVLVPTLGIAVFALDGIDSVRADVAYYPHGTIRHYVETDSTDGGRHVYWTPEGTIDREASHRRIFGWRVRGLTQQEARNFEALRREHDLACLNRAVSVFMNREEGRTVNPRIDNTAWARRQRAPESLAEVVAYEPSRHELLGSEAPLRDSWGREYLLRVDPDPSAPFDDAVHTTVFSRGSDAMPGGIGDAADCGMERDWFASRVVDRIP